MPMAKIVIILNKQKRPKTFLTGGMAKLGNPSFDVLVRTSALTANK